MAKPTPIILPDYWEEAKAELMRRDRILRKLIPKLPPWRAQSLVSKSR
jgi:DNA-3-methyladenine glycosylase II